MSEADHAASGAADLAALPCDVGGIDELELRDAFHPDLQCHPKFESGEVRPGTAVDAGTECHMTIVLAIEEHLIGALEHAGSRFAAGNAINIRSPACIGHPSNSVSCATIRAIVTGA